MTPASQRVSALDGLPLRTPFVTQRRTIGEGDFALLTNITWTTGESHAARREDQDGTEETRWLALPVVAAVIVGLAAKHWVSYHLREQHRMRVLASVELHVVGHAPVRPGDTLHCECELVDGQVEPGSDLAWVDVEERGYNQDGVLVAVVRQRWQITRELPG